jgi:hypothetical protein
MGFTDKERAAEEAKRRAANRDAEARQFEGQRSRLTRSDDLTCMICNLPFAAHQAANRELPICSNC